MFELFFCRTLSNELDGWMRDALTANGGRHGGPPVRAIIVPHAGYRYCGACAGHSYSQIDPSLVITSTIFKRLVFTKISYLVESISNTVGARIPNTFIYQMVWLTDLEWLGFQTIG